MNFIYDDFYLANNSTLHIYSSDTTMVLGGFTSQNNKKGGIFATGNVLGESVILELYEPLSDFEKNQFTISRIGYVYRNVLAVVNGELRGETYDECFINASCSEGSEWEDQKNGDVLMFITTYAGQGSCSAALVNNTALDCKPYILTANHCGWFSSESDFPPICFSFLPSLIE